MGESRYGALQDARQNEGGDIMSEHDKLIDQLALTMMCERTRVIGVI